MMRRLFTAAFLTLCFSTTTHAQETANADGAILRGLDRVSGVVNDVGLRSGKTIELGSLAVTLDECRYPVDNPSGDAYAHLTINDKETSALMFSGWMIASSPALVALEHPRYDVWVLRCAMAGKSAQ